MARERRPIPNTTASSGAIEDFLQRSGGALVRRIHLLRVESALLPHGLIRLEERRNAIAKPAVE